MTVYATYGYCYTGWCNRMPLCFNTIYQEGKSYSRHCKWIAQIFLYSSLQSFLFWLIL